jgi:hypothetical protein
VVILGKLITEKLKNQYTCTMDRSESSPSNAEARTGTPITGKGVSAATMPASHGIALINASETFDAL